MFVPRLETDSTFAGASLQWHETAITTASGERPFLGQIEPAKVLAVSIGRAAWRAKVLAVSKLPRHRVLCAKEFALLGLVWVRARKSSPRISRSCRGARKSSPCKLKAGEKRCFLVCWANFFAEVLWDGLRWANFFAEEPLRALIVNMSMYGRSPCGCRSSAGGPISHAIPLKAFQVLNSNR